MSSTWVQAIAVGFNKKLDRNEALRWEEQIRKVYEDIKAGELAEAVEWKLKQTLEPQRFPPSVMDLVVWVKSMRRDRRFAEVEKVEKSFDYECPLCTKGWMHFDIEWDRFTPKKVVVRNNDMLNVTSMPCTCQQGAIHWARAMARNQDACRKNAWQRDYVAEARRERYNTIQSRWSALSEEERAKIVKRSPATK